MPALLSEDLVTLTAAAALLPHRRSGRPTHPSTLFRWASMGLRGAKLEIVQVGGTKCTSRQALARFFEKLSRARSSEA
jgi:hypothetical protein